MLSPTEQKRLKKIVAEDNSRLVEIFGALSDANRCQLFRLIVSRSGINVTEAAKTLGLSLPLASQHLKILEQNDLLVKSKTGREVHYQLNVHDPIVQAVVAVTKK